MRRSTPCGRPPIGARQLGASRRRLAASAVRRLPTSGERNREEEERETKRRADADFASFFLRACVRTDGRRCRLEQLLLGCLLHHGLWAGGCTKLGLGGFL